MDIVGHVFGGPVALAVLIALVFVVVSATARATCASDGRREVARP
jgi:hypothetical protein